MFHNNTGTFTTCIMSDFFPPYSILFQLTIFKEESELWLTILTSGSTNGLQNTVWKTVKYVITIICLVLISYCIPEVKKSGLNTWSRARFSSLAQVLGEGKDFSLNYEFYIHCCTYSVWCSPIIFSWFILSFFDLINLFHKPFSLGRKIWVWIQASFVEHPP